MPADIEKKREAVYEMQHDVTKEQKDAPFDIDNCNKVIDRLIKELNEYFMTDLGTASSQG
jgi:hypothetical protein